jgi:hypothetical protein
MRSAANTRVHGLTVSVESLLNDTWDHATGTINSGFELRWILKAEVPINHRNHHLVAEWRLSANEACLDLAVLGAAVAVNLVAVVALLRPENDAVATCGCACAPRAVWLELAVLRTTVKGHGVAIVAALRAFDLPVATDGGRANARAAAALEADFDLARGRTAIASKPVPVITQLWKDRDTVAAGRCRICYVCLA